MEESLESFLRQDYAGEHELVIVNDYPLQRLHFDHPRVRIFNLDFTFETIGEKENFAVSACRYDTIAVWDDDDIALPNHLKNIDRYFSGHDLLHWERGVFFKKGRIAALTAWGTRASSTASRCGARSVGTPSRTQATTSAREPAAWPRGPRDQAAPPPTGSSWFYSWGNGSYHMSALGTDYDGRPDVVVRHSAHIEELRRQAVSPPGTSSSNRTGSRTTRRCSRSTASGTTVEEEVLVEEYVRRPIPSRERALHPRPAGKIPKMPRRDQR